MVPARERDRRNPHQAAPALLPAQLPARVLAPWVEARAQLPTLERNMPGVVGVAAARAHVPAPEPERAVAGAPPVRRQLPEVARRFDQYDIAGVSLALERKGVTDAVGGAERRDHRWPHLGLRVFRQGGDVPQEVHAWLRVWG